MADGELGPRTHTWLDCMDLGCKFPSPCTVCKTNINNEESDDEN